MGGEGRGLYKVVIDCCNSSIRDLLQPTNGEGNA